MATMQILKDRNELSGIGRRAIELPVLLCTPLSNRKDDLVVILFSLRFLYVWNCFPRTSIRDAPESKQYPSKKVFRVTLLCLRLLMELGLCS